MNKKQFASVLKAAIAHDAIQGKGFACYPVIGLESDSTPDDFAAYYCNNDMTIRGMFTLTVSPAIVETVRRMADELETSEFYQENGLGVASCLIIPSELIGKINRAAFGEHNPDDMVIFGASIGNGLPVFTQYVFEDESEGLVRY